MYSELEVKALEQHNYHRIREMIRVTYTMGYNIMKPGPWDFVLKLSVAKSTFNLSLLLIDRLLCCVFAAGACCSISTIFQSLMSIMKMVYYLVAPSKFYLQLRLACRHELLQKCELFAAVADLPIAQPLKQRVTDIMNQSWISTRRQLMFYLFSCIGILVNYFFNALVVNIYNALNASDNNFEVALPLPSFYPNWMDKGMSFPYYYLPLVLESCNLYICGMGAVSFDVLFIVLCMHGVGLMQSLTHMIEYATSPLIPQERRVPYLRHCIYQYQRVEAFALELNDTFRQIIIIQFILSLFCWGLVLFQISIGIASSLTIALRMLMYLAAGGYQIVIYCYNGQRFTTASERIPMAFYQCTWYEECREFRQLTRMMIMRTNRCFSLDVSWFSKMSLPTLMSMIRASGQYTVLLQNIMQKK
ncbi:odorant receptor 63a [Drosophila hydei]|uniref:Odorant receptor n=1 Tax=Drosophila hydei TaxID=7224 RepID=A0A6J1LW18_DROHY|nr:odorant receptor 63a [Drosophila hydei]